MQTREHFLCLLKPSSKPRTLQRDPGTGHRRSNSSLNYAGLITNFPAPDCLLVCVGVFSFIRHSFVVLRIWVSSQLCLSLLPFPGGHSQVILTQSEAVVKTPGESHKLTCATSGFDLSSYGMHWIRQDPGKGLEWLVYYYSTGSNEYASVIKGRFTASKGGSNFYLQMNSLKQEDTAIYYCARHTA